MSQKPQTKPKSAFRIIVDTTIWTLIGAAATVIATYYVIIDHRHPDHSVSDKLQALIDIVKGEPEKAATRLHPSADAALPSAASANHEPIAPTASSAGIDVSVSAIKIAEHQMFIRMRIRNNNRDRFYFTDARADGGQVAILDSGGHLESGFPAGMNFCNSNAASCLTNSNETMLSKLTYLDPGTETAVSMRYSIDAPSEAAAKSVSYSLILIGRTMSQADQNSPQPLQEYRFSFNDVPISVH
jgi:hypothetical protein